MALLKALLLALFICYSLAFLASSENCDPSDLSALKEFAGNLTNGSIISNWVDELTCCKWDGVECDHSGNDSLSSGKVTILNLSNKSLRGVISRSLGNLDQLTLIDLSYNHFEGVLPMEILNMKKLEFIDLSHNSLSGPLPKSLVESNSLRWMNISGNSFNGELIDLAGYTSLVALNISGNSFTGELDSQICSFSKKIQILDISMNEFTGDFDEFGNCSKSLQNLNIDGNLLSGNIPEELYSLINLEQLSISSNNISGQLSDNLSKLSSIKTLVISGNRFSGPIPNVFGNLTKLEHFVAYSNSFLGKLPNTLSQCSKLHVLDLRNNSLSGPIDLNFTNFPNLCMLDLATNHFSGSLPDLSSCRELKVLSFAKNSLNGEIPENYADLTSLLFLSLSNNSLVNLSGALSVLQHCPNLGTLILTKNFHGEKITDNVFGFKNLTILALGNCKLSGEIPSWLTNCSKLEVLDLSWNHLNGKIPYWIGQMENLFYLDFSNNSLTGVIPKSLTELKCLTSPCSSNLIPSSGIPLYVKRNQTAHGLQYNKASSFPPSIFLSNNRINGTIWPEIGKLNQLHVLDLSRNDISGTIPSSISNMANLENLDLSSNNISGTIPSTFNKLTFLSKFSVANNHLQGSIPTGGQFLSFPSSSFEGNPGLCGTIISPCKDNENLALNPGTKSGSKNKFPKGTIFGITIGVGVGIALLIAVILLKLSRRDNGDTIQDFDEENGRTHRLSEGPSKLVLFQNSDCKDLTVADLLISTGNFSQLNIVGCGGFGLVYKANFPNGTKAAVKKLSGDCGQMEREFQAEVEALSRAQHKNLVSLLGYCLHGNDRLLIYSYMENGSLDYWLHERVDGGSVLKWDTRLKIAKGSGHGLSYLHKEPNIIHRDIKTSNILLDEKFEAHLADFGLSRLLHPYDTHVTTDLVGTLGYIPPEYSQTLTATFKGDVYSFGVVLIELLTGRRPVEVCKGKNCRDLVSWVFQMKNERREVEIFDSLLGNKNNEKQLIEVLGIACKCLDRDPRRRPYIDEVVMWLDGVGTESMGVEFI